MLGLAWHRLLTRSLICAALASPFTLAPPASADEPGSETRQSAKGDDPQPATATDANEPPLLDDSDDIDDLLNMAESDVAGLARVNVTAPALAEVVSTVSRQESTVGRSPAAVFVITNEMIRRSGARSIPEALRMAPGVQVARIDANKWAISIRGFNGRFANKLLVQIDGRSVYTPLFAGVFWDVQDVLLEDVERIEVIRGPGATIWGANAVNGVINILTKKSSKTQGLFIESGGGTERGYANVRQGGELGDDAHYRVYGKWFERDRSFESNGAAHDDWRMGRGGFRIDWEPDWRDTITLQGDFYDGETGRRNLFASPTPPFTSIFDENARVTGGNLLWRMTRDLGDNSDWSLQAYYDRTEREFVQSGFEEIRDTFDIDFQHHFEPFENHSVIWGASYRHSRDGITNLPFALEITPRYRSIDLISYFIQDEITLMDDLLYLTAGTKLQHNDFTGFEVQPTGRLLWTPTERHSIWGSFSRAVRTPSRGEDDVRIRQPPAFAPSPPAPPGTPIFPVISGNRDVESELLHAYEIGIRHQPHESFSWDLSLFYHDYDNLVSSRRGPLSIGIPLTIPISINNEATAETYGFEIFGNYQVNDDWKLYGAYSFLKMQVSDVNGGGAERESPQNQVYLQSSWDLGAGLEFDAIGRYVDSLAALNTPSYFTMDLRLGWEMNDNLEFQIVGRHLLDASQPEHGFGFVDFSGNASTEIQREVYAGLIWRP